MRRRVPSDPHPGAPQQGVEGRYGAPLPVRARHVEDRVRPVRVSEPLKELPDAIESESPRPAGPSKEAVERLLVLRQGQLSCWA